MIKNWLIMYKQDLIEMIWNKKIEINYKLIKFIRMIKFMIKIYKII